MFYYVALKRALWSVVATFCGKDVVGWRNILKLNPNTSPTGFPNRLGYISNESDVSGQERNLIPKLNSLTHTLFTTKQTHTQTNNKSKKKTGHIERKSQHYRERKRVNRPRKPGWFIRWRKEGSRGIKTPKMGIENLWMTFVWLRSPCFCYRSQLNNHEACVTSHPVTHKFHVILITFRYQGNRWADPRRQQATKHQI